MSPFPFLVRQNDQSDCGAAEEAGREGQVHHQPHRGLTDLPHGRAKHGPGPVGPDFIGPGRLEGLGLMSPRPHGGTGGLIPAPDAGDARAVREERCKEKLR